MNQLLQQLTAGVAQITVCKRQSETDCDEAHYLLFALGQMIEHNQMKDKISLLKWNELKKIFFKYVLFVNTLRWFWISEIVTHGQ